MAHTQKDNQSGLLIAALGVVYGDIGTSPLYAFRESLQVGAIDHGLSSVLGVLSLIFWAIVAVVTIKYICFVMRADNNGEGGVLALLALALRPAEKRRKVHRVLLTIGLIGAALFYGDAIITPAISVLSAVEGLEVATPALKPFILPVTLGILVGLFVIQYHGTARVGKFFGPIMLLWFGTLGVIGLLQIIQSPKILAALNPLYGLTFIYSHGYAAFITLGAVVLAVTGGEALYADMGHFGKNPIRQSWFLVVFPALLLNYFGQGALVLSQPDAIENPFYLLVPGWGQLPLVILATAATIIASQAVISGAYSLTHQALQLGFLPRVAINHTSESERGQIYLPAINWALLIAVTGLVLAFRSSSALASAYGIAVTGTMLVDTILLYFVARHVWRWNVANTGALISAFLLVDLAFFTANTPKIVEGAWFPLLVGLLVYTVMSTWRRGRAILFKKLRYRNSLTVDEFLKSIAIEPPSRVPGTAVFLAAPGEGAPHALLHNLKFNKILHERVIILTILIEEIPRVAWENRYHLIKLELNFCHLTAHFGFMEFPDVPKIFEECQTLGLDYNPMETSFFLSRVRVLPRKEEPNMALWREKLFAVMLKNATLATDFFRVPTNQVMEFDLRVEI